MKTNEKTTPKPKKTTASKATTSKTKKPATKATASKAKVSTKGAARSSFPQWCIKLGYNPKTARAKLRRHGKTGPYTPSKEIENILASNA